MRTFIFIFFCLAFTACNRNAINDGDCQFLLNISVNETVNLNFPQFSQLQFPSTSAFLPNAGNGGIILVNTGSTIAAFDAADPNHIFDTCSILEINGVIGECGCSDRNRYNLINGIALEDSNLRCPLKRYRVERSANTLLIFN